MKECINQMMLVSQLASIDAKMKRLEKLVIGAADLNPLYPNGDTDEMMHNIEINRQLAACQKERDVLESLWLTEEKRKLLTRIIESMNSCIQTSGINPSRFPLLVELSKKVNDAKSIEEINIIAAEIRAKE